MKFRAVEAVCLSLLLTTAGCWFSFRAENRLCRVDEDCQSGYVCIQESSADGICQAPSDGGGAAETIDAGPRCVAEGPRLAVGDRFACGISGGDVICWGYDADGRIGTGVDALDTTSEPITVDFGASAPERWVSVAAGVDHACALSCEGQLWCWGANDSMKLGRPDQTGPVLTPGRVGPEGNTRLYRSVSLLMEGSCALRSEGSVECWGNNSDSVLGVPGSSTIDTPNSVSGMDQVEQLDCGRLGCCAKRLGATSCWGWANWGTIAYSAWRQSAEPRDRRIITPSVLDAGDNFPYFPMGLGTQNTCGVSDVGSLFCWGHPYEGYSLSSSEFTGILGPMEPVESELPLTPREVLRPEEGSEIVDVALTGDMICVLKESSTGARELLCWGEIGSDFVRTPTRYGNGVLDWVELANSTVVIPDYDDDTICGLRSTGEVRCLGTRLTSSSLGHDGLFTAAGVTLDP